MNASRIAFWLLAGALVGFGVIGALTIGLPFFLLGLGLVVFALVRRWFDGWWALLVGFGGLPALILLFDLLTAPPPCPPGPVTLQPGTTSYTCSGPLDNYRTLASIFGAIALAGLVWPLVRRLWAHGRRRPA